MHVIGGLLGRHGMCEVARTAHGGRSWPSGDAVGGVPRDELSVQLVEAAVAAQGEGGRVARFVGGHAYLVVGAKAAVGIALGTKLAHGQESVDRFLTG
eukprot:154652-Pleurochrysis_carterae.AAC.1